jgi:hypothetical protein
MTRYFEKNGILPQLFPMVDDFFEKAYSSNHPRQNFSEKPPPGDLSA